MKVEEIKQHICMLQKTNTKNKTLVNKLINQYKKKLVILGEDSVKKTNPKYKGVFKNKGSVTYRAIINIKGCIYLGSFKQASKGSKAYQKALKDKENGVNKKEIQQRARDGVYKIIP